MALPFPSRRAKSSTSKSLRSGQLGAALLDRFVLGAPNTFFERMSSSRLRLLTAAAYVKG
jgi:hypothetical protein